MNSYLFSELKVGTKESFEVTISQDMMDSFRAITGDINPLHNDELYAIKRGYHGAVCFGMLTASLLSTLAGVYLPGEHCLIQEVDTKFVKPVYVGDHLTVVGEIIEINDTVKQAVVKAVIKNQEDKKVLRAKMKVGFTNE